MSASNYYVFGLGSGRDNLFYIGWSEKSPERDHDQIFADLIESRNEKVAGWVAEAVDKHHIDIFEIETAACEQEASEAVVFWCDYYRWLGLEMEVRHI